MKERVGDLLELAQAGEFDVIVHGCNCFHTFGAGIARAIKQRWPATHHADVTQTIYGDRKKLGTIIPVSVSDSLTVINAYTQYGFQRGALPNVDYAAVRSCFREIANAFGRKGLAFGIPKIGAGLAGGDWDIISKMIAEEMKIENVTVVVLPGRR